MTLFKTLLIGLVLAAFACGGGAKKESTNADTQNACGDNACGADDEKQKRVEESDEDDEDDDAEEMPADGESDAVDDM